MAQPASNGPSDKLASEQASPLLALPAELRHEIYSYVLGGRTICMGCRRDQSLPVVPGQIHAQLRNSNNHSHHVRAHTQPPHNFALLQTCRQIYAEARTLPFSLNTCKFDYECFEYWADTEERVQYIRTLAVKDGSLPDCGWQRILLRRGMSVLAGVVVVEVWSDDKGSRSREGVHAAEEVALHKEVIMEALGREVEVKLVHGQE